MSLCRSELCLLRPGLRTHSPSRVTRLFSCGLAVIAAALVSPVRFGVVHGQSMEPTLSTGQPFVYRKFSPERDVLRHGELVVVRLRGQVCIKRLYALEQDEYWSMTTPAAANELPGLLGVNDPIALWRRRFPLMSYQRRRVPESCVYVVGDSPTRSTDSRQLGPVPIRNVLGRVVWPAVGAPPVGGSISHWADCPRRPRSIKRVSGCEHGRTPLPS